MRTANTHKNMARCAATATLACVLGLGLAAPAYADTASDLAAARTKLEQIGTQTQQIYDELATQTQALDQTAGEITQKQQEIADGQAKLSTYVAGEYKTGGLSLLQVLTGVDDLSDMLNRLFYYGKVSDKQAQTIQEVKELKQQLTDKQAEQEKNVATTQKKVDELNAQQAEAQNVVNSLDSQLQAELAAEAEANAALQAGINASTAEKATVSNETAGTTEKTNNGGQTSNNNNPGRQHSGSYAGTLLRRRSPPHLLRLRRLLLRASPSMAVLLSRVHTASLVAPIPGAELARTAFDCSGFVSYCLTGRYCRLGTTGTFMGWTRVSDPQPGDVVVNSYHTGIYIGGGQMIHASDYNTGVIISSVAAGMNNNYIFVRY
ncbi:NlpC/P60 family protein [Collinsella aerofaciens ATCC 25986]|uniref:NlpC/P60 family protein n=2 Tax=Collinsella aerofaciens TaxID=74426 RepID=A4ECA3_COLAA|nr:NlpC/P60 family protein [Collinsella aerofaciens]EBA38803.1 NlpC/P60 family protein [Collinsella aerofaciens ATCC 25986]